MLARRRDAPDCIISTAQQASPNVIGIIEPLRAQLQSSSSFVTTNSAAATKREILRRHNARGEETYKITPGTRWPLQLTSAALSPDHQLLQALGCGFNRAPAAHNDEVRRHGHGPSQVRTLSTYPARARTDGPARMVQGR
jgi:hypothetical protein